MLKTNSTSRRWRFGAVGAGIVVVTGLLATGSASAATDPGPTSLSATVSEAYGRDKVSSTIAIDGSAAVINRLPNVAATDAELAKRNATAPTLSCKVGSATITATGEYVNLDGVVAMFFDFVNNFPPAAESCTVAKSSFINATADTTYPFTAAARAALWGNPAKALDAAKSRLSGVAPTLGRLFTGSWGTDYVQRIAKAVPQYKWTGIHFRIDATSTSAKSMYISRPTPHGAAWINVCQRLVDGRIVCMKYHPVSKKKTFSVDSINTNLYTVNSSTEEAAS